MVQQVKMKIFVDGVLNNSKIKNFLHRLFISNGSSDNRWPEWLLIINRLTGSLDEIAIFNSELTPSEVAIHYNNGATGYFAPAAPSITSTPLTTGSDRWNYILMMLMQLDTRLRHTHSLLFLKV